jgi:hypothetical protein
MIVDNTALHKTKNVTPGNCTKKNTKEGEYLEEDNENRLTPFCNHVGKPRR